MRQNMKKGKHTHTLRGKIISSTLAAAIAPILLCITVLLLMIYNVLASYIQNDMDFAMKEISGNLNNKTVFLEDILLSVRHNQELMQMLKNGGVQNAEASEALKRAANLYSNKNTDGLAEPFLDFLYLFDQWGNFCETSYTDPLSNIREENHQIYTALWNDFNVSKKDTSISLRGGRLAIAYTLFDQEMQPVGTLIFAVNCKALRQMMLRADEYKGGFWFLWDERGTPALLSKEYRITEEDTQRLVTEDRSLPHDQTLDSNRYRIYSQNLGMGLSATIGVPSNQLLRLLFDSVKFYLFIPAILLLFVVLFLFYRIMHLTKPLSEVAESLKLVADQKFDAKLPYYGSEEFDAISHTFNAMTETIDHLVNDVYEKKLLVMDSELRFLQSQMNPHFLYNVLSTIALKARLDHNEDIYKMASSFAGLTQARLYHRGDEKITVAEELQLVRFYLDLQKFRFEDKLTYHIEIHEEERLLSCQIPKLLIEFMVENAVVHGLEPKSEPGAVYVDISAEKEDLVICVEDNGVGFLGQNGVVSIDSIIKNVPQEGHNRIALLNAQKIIQLYYGEPYGITIQSREGVGTIVLIRIPMQGMK